MPQLETRIARTNGATRSIPPAYPPEPMAPPLSVSIGMAAPCDSSRNGLDKHGVILRLGNKGKGNRILIREDRFLAWADAVGAPPS